MIKKLLIRTVINSLCGYFSGLTKPVSNGGEKVKAQRKEIGFKQTVMKIVGAANFRIFTSLLLAFSGTLLIFPPIAEADLVYSFTNSSFAYGHGISILDTKTGAVTGFNLPDVFVDGGLAVQGSNVYSFTNSSFAYGHGISILDTTTGAVTGFNLPDAYVGGGLAVVSAVPIPSSFIMMISGFGLLKLINRRRKLNNATSFSK